MYTGISIAAKMFDLEWPLSEIQGHSHCVSKFIGTSHGFAQLSCWLWDTLRRLNTWHSAAFNNESLTHPLTRCVRDSKHAYVLMALYTLWMMQLLFLQYNFGKCRPILIILSPLHSKINYRRSWNKIYYLTSNLLPHCLNCKHLTGAAAKFQ